MSTLKPGTPEHLAAEARSLIASLEASIAPFLNAEGDVDDWYRYDATVTNFADDALDLLRNFVALADEPPDTAHPLVWPNGLD